MAKTLEQIATDILLLLARIRASDGIPNTVDGPTLKEVTGLSVSDINDAVWLLKNSGYVETVQFLSTQDYSFTTVAITALGRYEAERVSGALADPIRVEASDAAVSPKSVQKISLPPVPVGSPYGFTDEDWEFIAQQKGG